MSLPQQYEWLLQEPGPKMLKEAIALYGTKEQPGSADNPEILSWAQETGLRQMYSADATPWCGLFMAVVANRAGKDIPKDPLWAKNWAKFGIESAEPALGDTMVFKRETGGHVAIYVGEDDSCYHVIGGNQSDAVTITRIAKTRLIASRRPKWQHLPPANIRRIYLYPTGKISTNES